MDALANSEEIDAIVDEFKAKKAKAPQPGWSRPKFSVTRVLDEAMMKGLNVQSCAEGQEGIEDGSAGLKY